MQWTLLSKPTVSSFFSSPKLWGRDLGRERRRKAVACFKFMSKKRPLSRERCCCIFLSRRPSSSRERKKKKKKDPKSCFGSKPTQPNPPFPISPLPTYIPTYASCMFYVCVASQIASSMSVCLSALPKLNRPSWKKKIDPSSKRPSISSNVIWQGDIAKSKLAPSCQLEKRREREKKEGFNIRW